MGKKSREEVSDAWRELLSIDEIAMVVHALLNTKTGEADRLAMRIQSESAIQCASIHPWDDDDDVA